MQPLLQQGHRQGLFPGAAAAHRVEQGQQLPQSRVALCSLRDSPVSAVKAANMASTARAAGSRRVDVKTAGTLASTRSLGTKLCGFTGRSLSTTTHRLMGSSIENRLLSNVGVRGGSGVGVGVGVTDGVGEAVRVTVAFACGLAAGRSTVSTTAITVATTMTEPTTTRVTVSRRRRFAAATERRPPGAGRGGSGLCSPGSLTTRSLRQGIRSTAGRLRQLAISGRENRVTGNSPRGN